MKTTRQPEELQPKKVASTQMFHPAAGGLFGALVGATVGVIGVYAMRNEKTRARIEKVVKTFGAHATEYFNTIKGEATTELKEIAEDTVQDVRKAIIHKSK